MLKMLESEQGLRAGQLFQLSGIHDEKQQQPSGNMQESGNCLISYDSRCQISHPIRFLQRESLEQVEYFSYLCSITAQFSGDPTGHQLLRCDITGKNHMAISKQGQAEGECMEQMDCFNYLGPLMNKNFNCHQQILWQASNNCTVWHNLKIWCGLSISTAVKLRFVLALAWPTATSSAEGGTLRKLFVSASKYFMAFHSLFLHCRENTDPAPSFLLAPFDFIVCQKSAGEN